MERPQEKKRKKSSNNNIRSRAPRNHYEEDQLRIEALETIPTYVLSMEQRRLLEEHGHVQVQEDREEMNRELIDTVKGRGIGRRDRRRRRGRSPLNPAIELHYFTI